MKLQQIRERVELIAGGRATDPDEATHREIVLYRMILQEVSDDRQVPLVVREKARIALTAGNFDI